MTHPGALEAHTEDVEAFLRTKEPLRLALEMLIYHSVPTDRHHGAIKTLQAAIIAQVGLEGSPWSHEDSP
jgi:hypothetical protein